MRRGGWRRALILVGAIGVMGVGEGCLWPSSYRCEDIGGGDIPCWASIVPGLEPTATCRPESGCRLEPGCRWVHCWELTEALCEAIPICSWKGTECVWRSAEVPCPELDQAACGADPNCVWDLACVGERIYCPDIENEAACGRVPHCGWREVPKW